MKKFREGVVKIERAKLFASSLFNLRQEEEYEGKVPVDKDGAQLLPGEEAHAAKFVSDESITGLSEQIKREGQLTPLIVITMAEAREKLKDYCAKAPKDAEWFLVCGFRRNAALEILKSETADARVCEGGTAAEYLLLNVTENIGRKDVGTFSLARRFVQLKEDGLKAEKIAEAMVGGGKVYTVGYVNNLCRMVTGLDKDIIVAWSKGDPRCSQTNLAVAAAIKDREQQKKWFNESLDAGGHDRGDDAAAGDGSDGGGGNGGARHAHVYNEENVCTECGADKPGRDKKVRGAVMASAYQNAKDALPKAKGEDAQLLAGIATALKWAMKGGVLRAGKLVVYDAKAEEKDRAAKKAEEKAAKKAEREAAALEKAQAKEAEKAAKLAVKAKEAADAAAAAAKAVKAGASAAK